MRVRAPAVVAVVGIALVGISAGVVSGLNAKQKAYTVQQLSAHWKAPYDLLVLPKGSPSVVGKLADPNAIDEGQGGITLAQWKEIEGIKGVAVAAPLVPIGLVNFGLVVSPLALPGSPGIFSETVAYHNVGLPDSITPRGFVSAVGLVGNINYAMSPLAATDSGLLVAIDPAAEAKLVGLNAAVTDGLYLKPGRSSIYEIPNAENGLQTRSLFYLPTLLTALSPVFGTQSITVQHLDIPFSAATAMQYMDHQPPAGVKGKVEFSATISDASLFQGFERLQLNPTTKSLSIGPIVARQNNELAGFVQRPSLVAYRRVRSPYPSRWPIALQAEPFACGSSRGWCSYYKQMGEPFRSLSFKQPVDLYLSVVGVYNPLKLKEANDPLTHLPLLNYRPEQGLLVLDSNGKAVNPPQTVLPGISPLGLFDPMPAAITTIQNAEPILGRAPISSVRVKVSGVNDLSLGAQAQLQAVANHIRQKTGLAVEIVQGAAPQQVLVHPGYEKGYTKVGWIQEEWVRLGAGFEILRQTLLSQDVILIPVLFGAFVFALTAGVIGVEVRRKEYATLLAIGVAPRTVQSSVLWEGLIYALTVAILAIGAAYYVGGQSALAVTVPVGVIAGLMMFLALIPVARAVAHLEPLSGLKDAAPALSRILAPVSVLGMGLSLFFSSLRRHVASLVALLIPGAVFYLIFAVQSALHQTMYLTTLGQYLLVRVGPLMELGALVTVVLAILASAQIGLRNATLRARTWAIGQAMGWARTTPIYASLVEALAVGLIAGVLGVSAGTITGWVVFGTPPQAATWSLAVAVILVSGLLAATPATIAIARQEPVAHLKGDVR